MAYTFTQPGRTYWGSGALEASVSALCALGSKAFVVTGPHVAKSGPVERLTALLAGQGVSCEVFDGITGEPTTAMIDAGLAAYRATGCDFLIGIGGGSPLDSVKAIAALSVLPGRIAAYLGKEIAGDFPRMALIPTTAGTGSEATKFTIITDEAADVKMLLKGDALLPQVAVVDPVLTQTAPPSVTAATGMDALTHAIESYTSRKANPLTDLYALDAIQRIFAFLPRAFRDGADARARGEMALAAYEAGLCINNASVTLVHGMSRPIGALFHVPHGISNAMLLGECLGFARSGCPERFAAAARAIGAAKASQGDEEASLAFFDALGRLCKELDIPTLAAYGIDRSRFDAVKEKMAADALASGSPGNTIRPVTQADMVELYGRLW